MVVWARVVILMDARDARRLVNSLGPSVSRIKYSLGAPASQLGDSLGACVS